MGDRRNGMYGGLKVSRGNIHVPGKTESTADVKSRMRRDGKKTGMGRLRGRGRWMLLCRPTPRHPGEEAAHRI